MKQTTYNRRRFPENYKASGHNLTISIYSTRKLMDSKEGS